MSASSGGPASLATPPAAARRRAVVLGALLVLAYLALRVPGLLTNSATYDEPIYLGASMRWTATYDRAAAAMLYHPPLAYHLIDLPLRFVGAPVVDAWDPDGANTQVGLRVLYDTPGVAPETVLLLARLPILLVGALALPLLFALGRRLGGDRAGWLAAAAWALFPEAAAQSVQATTDCVAAVAAFALALAALRHLDAVRSGGPSRGTLVALGVATGLALLAKHTLLVHAAVVAVALLAFRALTVRRLLAAAGIAAAVVWAGYGFEFRPAVPATGGHETLDRLARMLHVEPSTLEGPARAVPLPAPSYLRSVADALLSKTSAREGTLWSAYMDGAWSERGFLGYFPYATVVKTPVVLLLIALAGIAGGVHRRGAFRDRPREAGLLLALFAVPFAVAVASRLNIGFRHLLPVLPFAFVLGAAEVARAALHRTAVVGVLVLVSAIEVLDAVRDPIPFANRVAGGPAALHRKLADSNLEVGQDLRRVAAWAREHDVAKIAVVLHGPPGLYERECAREPRFERYDVAPTGTVIHAIRTEDQSGAVPRDGLLAVGESMLVLPRWRRLLDVPPLAQVGRTRIFALPR